jgi:hypothetical protein
MEFYYIIDSRKGHPAIHCHPPLEIEDELNKMTDEDLDDITIIKGVEIEAIRKITLKEVE